MLLSIITRTFNGRPAGMKRLRDSLDSQTSRDFEHVLLVDDQRRGVEWANSNLWRALPNIHGDYIMIVDDDDYLVDANFVELLADEVKDKPEIVIIRMDMSNGLVLPELGDWESRPVHSRIAVSCHLTRRDIFEKHVRDFGHKYDGDFDYIRSVWDCGHPFKWWDRVVSKIGTVSHGKPE